MADPIPTPPTLPAAASRGRLRLRFRDILVFIALAVPPALLLFIPFRSLSELAARLVPFAVVIASISFLGNLASLPAYAKNEVGGVQLDAVGKTMRFLASSATLWAAISGVIVGTINDWGGGSSGIW